MIETNTPLADPRDRIHPKIAATCIRGLLGFLTRLHGAHNTTARDTVRGALRLARMDAGAPLSPQARAMDDVISALIRYLDSGE